LIHLIARGVDAQIIPIAEKKINFAGRIVVIGGDNLFCLRLEEPRPSICDRSHWRRCVTWTKETIDAEIAKLLVGCGSKFEIRFA
jgi:hypothetical protein